MDDHKQLLFINHYLPGPEQQLVDKLRESADRRNSLPSEALAALRGISLDAVADIVVGPRHLGILFQDGRVARLAFSPTTRALPQPCKESEPAPSSTRTLPVPSSAPTAAPASGAPASNLPPSAQVVMSRTTKFRRVMLATSTRRGERGIIVDRGRPMVPASSVPEDLIAQAQVVLQGKSREVIVRELQRSNLNVNEAVNNLLSREEDDEDGSDGAGEVCLPEELLSLLDASHGSLLESDIYGGDSFEYLLTSRERERRRAEEKKDKTTTKAKPVEAPPTEGARRFEVEKDNVLEWWEGDVKMGSDDSYKTFICIASTMSEMLGVGKDGKLYGWHWSREAGQLDEHPIMDKIKKNQGETITHLTACSLRAAVFTSEKRMATWIDHISSGKRVTEALLVPLARLPGHNEEKEEVKELVVSPTLAVARCDANVFYWCGIYPQHERKRLFEKARSRLRKHVTFDTAQITEGSEVRTKSGPIYSAGSIAVNMGSGGPVVGILMESAWSLTEMCRFRVFATSAYDEDVCPPPCDDDMEGEIEGAEEKKERVSSDGGSRKRPATEPVDAIFNKVNTSNREEAWNISEILFIHEEVQNDTAIVKIVDGAHCALEYQKAPASPTDCYATPASRKLACNGEKDKPLPKMRLLRKDELTVVNQRVRNARSPTVFRTEPTRFVLTGSSAQKRVVSAVADSLGIRVLVEKRGSSSPLMCRLSVAGRTLSTHVLPIYGPSLHGGGRPPRLMNGGDDLLLLIRDGFGGLIALTRDAAAGFKEPTCLQLPSSAVSAIGVCSLAEKDKPTTASKANREAVIISLVGTNPRTLEKGLPSLMQAILHCDERAVKMILDKLADEQYEELARREIVEAHSDGGRNILHAAVMYSFATKNSLEADVEIPGGDLTAQEARSVVDHQRALDQKWQMMLRSKRSAEAAAASQATESVASSTDGNQSKDGSDKATAGTDDDDIATRAVKMEVDDDDVPLAIRSRPVENARTRQGNSIEIVKAIVTHPITLPYLSSLLEEREVGGQTPFMAAVNVRAYTAARHILAAVLGLFIDEDKDKTALKLNSYLYPTGSRPDDSPLFVLCYNDNCSFTWTGEEHINQDIFECRTCGLIGTLCCCTECALTCHRNHECKLKRTSPTAYCDCWEKACCKALVAGNQAAREKLLKELLERSALYRGTSARGEHLALFLLKKYARQRAEQDNHNRRPRRAAAVGGGAVERDREMPEHNLAPPSFAKIALQSCLSNWDVIKSISDIGMRHIAHDQLVAEDVLFLNSQHGANHLDKFMFILLSKGFDQCPSIVETLLKELCSRANAAYREGGKEAEEVTSVVSRFCRSVARLYIVATILSPLAAQHAITGLLPGRDTPEKPFRTVSLTGFFSMVRAREASNSSKEHKQKAMASFVVRCRGFLHALGGIAAYEVACMADALMAPVRTGIVRPSLLLHHIFSGKTDDLSNLENFLNGENDLSHLMTRAESVQSDDSSEKKIPRGRKRFAGTGRRETEREEGRDEVSSAMSVAREAVAEARDSSVDSEATEGETDSEGEGEPHSRRLTSQSSAIVTAEELSSAQEDDATPKAPRRSNRPFLDDSADFSSGEEDESDGKDDDDDDDDDDEDGDVEMEEADDGDADVVYSDEDSTTRDSTRDRTRGGRNGVYVEGEEDDDYSPSSPNYEEEDRDPSAEQNAMETDEDESSRPPRADATNESAREGDATDALDPPPPRSAHSQAVSRALQTLDELSSEFRAQSAAARRIRASQGAASVELEAAREEEPVDYAEVEVGGEGQAEAEAAQESAEDKRVTTTSTSDASATLPISEGTSTEGEERDVTARTSSTSDNRARRGGFSGSRSTRMTLHPMSTSSPRNDEERDRDRERDRGRDRDRDELYPFGRPDLTSRTLRRNAFGNWGSRGAGVTSSSGTARGGAEATNTTSGRGGSTRLSWYERDNTRNGRSAERFTDRPIPRDTATSSTANTTTNNNETSGERGGSGGDPGGEARVTTKASDDTPTSLKTSIQLAAGFSFAVRLLSELYSQLMDPAESENLCTRELNFRFEPFSVINHQNLKKLFEDKIAPRLAPTFTWAQVVLDQVEAQIKYGNAVMAAYGTEIAECEKKGKKDDKRKKDRKDHANRDDMPHVHGPCTQKRESLDIIFSVMRCHSNEAGDDWPPVDVEALKPLALVIDQFLGWHKTLTEEETKKGRESIGGATPEKIKPEENLSAARSFFKRSNSVSYPGVSLSDMASNTIAAPVSTVPLVDRPYLLTPAADKETLFGAPSQQKTRQQHHQTFAAHGQGAAHNQSLAIAHVPIHEDSSKDASSLHESASAPVIHDEKKRESSTPRRTTRSQKKAEEKKGKKDDKDKMNTSGESRDDGKFAVYDSPPVGFEHITLEEIQKTFEEGRRDMLTKSLSRWRNALQLMAKEFSMDLLGIYGGQMINSTLLNELSGFQVKQSLFRRRMDKYRSGLSKDVSLEVHRDPMQLVRETVFQLNKMYMRRIAQNGPRQSGADGKTDEKLPPLAAHKVKVKFHDEPGEGTGVARSFYTALAEALQAQKSFPFTDFGWNSTNDDYLYGGPAGLMSAAPSPADRASMGTQFSGRSDTRRIVVRGRDAIFTAHAPFRRNRGAYGRRYPLNLLAQPYTPADMAAAEALSDSPEAIMEAEFSIPPPPPPVSAPTAPAPARPAEESVDAERDRLLNQAPARAAPSLDAPGARLGSSLLDRLFLKVRTMQPSAASRITGMLAEVPSSTAVLMLTDQYTLKQYVTDAVDQMVNGGAASDLALLKNNDDTAMDDEDSRDAPAGVCVDDDAPLFFRSSKRAHYSPVPGRLSPMRISAFRNVGRIIGLCISQCELFPLRVSRHVLKFILGRPLTWHDFAFFDPQMFETLRGMIVEGHEGDNHAQYFDDLQLNFTADVPPEAAGKPSSTVELVEGGENIAVTRDNVVSYVYRYVEARLLGENTRCLQAIRQGVHDVVPKSMLENLTAEDLRLILCGSEQVSMSLMQGYTTWTDESHASPDATSKFKRWFWEVAEHLSNQEKQDLIFFWTGSPSLPSSEEGFQPPPTVVIRPAEEEYLPTANTCISRLYLPLYGSKKVLHAKLALAIKTKSFGFV